MHFQSFGLVQSSYLAGTRVHEVPASTAQEVTRIYLHSTALWAVLDLGLISIGSLGPRALTKVESHVNFTESKEVSQPNFFAILNTEKLAKTTN